MIFAAPRFIAIDDEVMHLKAVSETMQQLGTTCFGLHYDGESVFDPLHFAGVRCIFMDLHLTLGVSPDKVAVHYALITSLLEANINRDGGPFVLIVWTAEPQLSDELKAYLEARLTGDQAYALPLAVLPLPKSKYIDLTNGTALDARGLEAEIKNLVFSIPQLAALLSWEVDVLSAAGKTLGALRNLVPADKRNGTSYANEIDLILSRLACEAVGPANVAADVSGAVSKALAPILADRIMNQRVDPTAQFWAKAVTKHGKDTPIKASPQEAGNINRMLHVAMPPSEPVTPTAWGAVCQWPVAWIENPVLPRLGFTKADLLKDEFKVSPENHDNCRLVLVRIGASCDAAQNNAGPVSYLLGAEIPQVIRRSSSTEAIWPSPTFALRSNEEPFILCVHSRFPVTVLSSETEGWTAKYRLREQLLSHLITKASSYVARPGIVQLHPAKQSNG